MNQMLISWYLFLTDLSKPIDVVKNQFLKKDVYDEFVKKLMLVLLVDFLKNRL